MQDVQWKEKEKTGRLLQQHDVQPDIYKRKHLAVDTYLFVSGQAVVSYRSQVHLMKVQEELQPVRFHLHVLEQQKEDGNTPLGS